MNRMVCCAGFYLLPPRCVLPAIPPEQATLSTPGTRPTGAHRQDSHDRLTSFLQMRAFSSHEYPQEPSVGCKVCVNFSGNGNTTLPVFTSMSLPVPRGTAAPTERSTSSTFTRLSLVTLDVEQLSCVYRPLYISSTRASTQLSFHLGCPLAGAPSGFWMPILYQHALQTAPSVASLALLAGAYDAHILTPMKSY